MKVYVTSHGSAFHHPLRHIMTGSSKVLIDVWKAKREGYRPCDYCFGSGAKRPSLRRDPSEAFLRLAQEVAE